MKKLNYEHSESYDCFVTNSVGIDLVVFECGYEKCDPFHCWGPERKQAHFFHYVISGKGRLYIEDQCYECGPGDLFYLSPREMAYYEADGSDPWEYKWVGFTGIRAESLIGNTLFPRQPLQHRVDSLEVQTHMDNIFTSFQSERTPNLLAVGHLYLFLAWITQQFPAKQYSKEDADEQRFFTMLRFIQLKYTTKVKVSDMAEALNYDRTYIYKMFMKYIHLSQRLHRGAENEAGRRAHPQPSVHAGGGGGQGGLRQLQLVFHRLQAELWGHAPGVRRAAGGRAAGPPGRALQSDRQHAGALPRLHRRGKIFVKIFP